MNNFSHKEPDTRITTSDIPHLSYSRIDKYLLCPEQYRLYYLEHLRTRVSEASLVFGQIVHQALHSLFRAQADPVNVFTVAWNEAKHIDLNYSQRETWEKLNTCGKTLLEQFVMEEVPKLGTIHASEKPFEFSFTELDVPFMGIIDLIADVTAKTTVVDFKTSSSVYADHTVILADQLTAYHIAEPQAEQSALCVFVKTKAPKIEWYFATRTVGQLLEYLSKAGLVAREIVAGHFYKRTGMWCAWCDYLPVCMGDAKKVKETLVQIE